MKQIASTADLEMMRALPRALVFIFVNWSMQARRSDAACQKLLATLQGEYHGEDIPAFRVDLSDQEGELWIGIRKWLENGGQPHDKLSYGGNGAMLWVRSGVVAAYAPYLAEIETYKLMAMTRGVFELTAGSGIAG
jgi:hypothetical protein